MCRSVRGLRRLCFGGVAFGALTHNSGDKLAETCGRGGEIGKVRPVHNQQVYGRDSADRCRVLNSREQRHLAKEFAHSKPGDLYFLPVLLTKYLNIARQDDVEVACDVTLSEYRLSGLEMRPEDTFALVHVDTHDVAAEDQAQRPVDYDS